MTGAIRSQAGNRIAEDPSMEKRSPWRSRARAVIAAEFERAAESHRRDARSNVRSRAITPSPIKNTGA
jgi:hypothetical protein